MEEGEPMAYEFTERRRVTALENLKKAREAHRARRVPRPERPPNLKHGYFARDLRRSVILLGEDVAEYDAHLQRFRDALTPRNERERILARRLGETAWQLIRTYHARAHCLARKIRQKLDRVVGCAPLPDWHLRDFGYMMTEIYLLEEPFLQHCSTRMRKQFERLFRLFLIERIGTDQGLCPRSRVTPKYELTQFDLEAPFQ
jgi:hypothetical protein